MNWTPISQFSKLKKYTVLEKKLFIMEDSIETISIVFNVIDLILLELILNINNASKTQNELPIEVNKIIITVLRLNISKSSIPVMFENVWIYTPEKTWPKKSPGIIFLPPIKVAKTLSPWGK